MDADVENSSTADISNSIDLTDGRVLTSKALLTLEATMGQVMSDGRLTLRTGTGVVILNDLTATTSSSELVINADYESAGDGTLTLVSTKTISSNDSTIVLTAWDIDMSGSITAGAMAMTIHGAKTDQTIALGSTPNDLTLSDAEVGRVTARGGLTLGSSMLSHITVDGLTDSSTDELDSLLLLATRADRNVNFALHASSFNKGITVQAASGVSMLEKFPGP